MTSTTTQAHRKNTPLYSLPLPDALPILLTLNNGAPITFTPDYVPGTVVQSTEFAVQTDDVYNDAGTETISIASTNGGGNFENLDTSATATIEVTDNEDTATVSLQGTSA